MTTLDRAPTGTHDGVEGSVDRRRYVDIGPLVTESGMRLDAVTMAYESWGTLNPAGDNAVLVLHALTGDSHVVGPTGPHQPTPGWWDGLIGPGGPVDTDRYFALAANVLGGCRGSTGPSSIAPDGRPYGSRFPRITIRDQVAAEAAFTDALGITRFQAVVGGSMGGMRALEWAVTYPDRVARCLALATCACCTADQIARGTAQLAVIRADPAFAGGDYYAGPAPLAGMAIARQIAHTTYRAALELNTRFGRSAQADEDPLRGGRFAVESYLQHHGRKLGGRFDPNSYIALTEAMHTHDIGRDRGGVDAALHRISAELTVSVVDSDRLFLPAQGELIGTAPTARPLVVMHSDHGHDGFLIEADAIAAVVREALARPPLLSS